MIVFRSTVFRLIISATESLSNWRQFNSLSKMVIKKPVFVKKLKVSCSLDHTYLFKCH